MPIYFYAYTHLPNTLPNPLYRDSVTSSRLLCWRRITFLTFFCLTHMFSLKHKTKDFSVFIYTRKYRNYHKTQCTAINKHNVSTWVICHKGQCIIQLHKHLIPTQFIVNWIYSILRTFCEWVKIITIDKKILFWCPLIKSSVFSLPHFTDENIASNFHNHKRFTYSVNTIYVNSISQLAS